MELSVNQILRHACQLLLRPVATVLLRSGMTWREFSEISKGVFVDVASEEFGIKGRPTNVSRASILTGISRKEVKRQRQLLQSKSEAIPSKSTDATRLLSGWHQDPLYVDDEGNPLPLNVDGPAPSFTTLFEAYGTDAPEQTMIKELVSAGSVERNDVQKLVAKRRFHMPAAMDVGNLQFFGRNLFDHAQTLSNNLSGPDAEKRLEGFAVETHIDARAVSDFHEFTSERGQQLLEEVDDWLNSHRVNPDDDEASHIRLGLGVYAIEGRLPKGTYT